MRVEYVLNCCWICWIAGIICRNFEELVCRNYWTAVFNRIGWAADGAYMFIICTARRRSKHIESLVCACAHVVVAEFLWNQDTRVEHAHMFDLDPWVTHNDFLTSLTSTYYHSIMSHTWYDHHLVEHVQWKAGMKHTVSHGRNQSIAW